MHLSSTSHFPFLLNKLILMKMEEWRKSSLWCHIIDYFFIKISLFNENGGIKEDEGIFLAFPIIN
jgi:hypothetical protein